MIHGDCIDILRSARSGAVDLVVTDPPYVVNFRDRSGRSIRNDACTDWILRQSSVAPRFCGSPRQ
jgi:site-specific DNA-methyltransferase (adenine-specific)